jgi:uncharacterized membrane protein
MVSMENNGKVMKPTPITVMIGVGVLILLASSIARHLLFQSSAFDLGIFDQAIYLISQGYEPISSFLNFHILGDHASIIHYLLAFLYKIYPTVYWLFIVQSLVLALAALPIWCLAIEAGLSESQSLAVAAAYLLYPVVFNANLFDFHPEVIAVPLILAAVLFAHLKKFIWFCLCLILILFCKAVLSLTIISMGIWLLLERKTLYGLLAIISGLTWFIIATKLIIPGFSGAEAAAVGRYSYLGDSVFDIAKNIVFQPSLIFNKLFSLNNLGYLILLLAPMMWGLSSASLKPLIGAIPCVFLNLITDYQPQKDLIYQYSLPALPFLVLAVIASLAIGKGLIKNRKGIIVWSLITFLCLAKFTYFTSKYLAHIDNLSATREAVHLVKNKGGVLTNSFIVPHLSHRKLIRYTDAAYPDQELDIFDYVLLNVRHPGWGSDEKFSKHLVQQLEKNPKYQKKYQRDDVLLFVKG